MGPRLGSRGDALASCSTGMLPAGLQWGRGWVAAETLVTDVHPFAAPASMGPRLGSRGDTTIVTPVPLTYQLQWGRGWVAAETVVAARKTSQS